MTRLLPWAAAAAAACSVAFFLSPVSAQTASSCGAERWSQAEMRYVAVPCAAQATKTADGKACGERWSQAEMRYVGVPCTAQVAKAPDGKETCGGERWSQAEMRYVVVPCAQR
jgi:hypothetical protein